MGCQKEEIPEENTAGPAITQEPPTEVPDKTGEKDNTDRTGNDNTDRTGNDNTDRTGNDNTDRTGDDNTDSTGDDGNDDTEIYFTYASDYEYNPGNYPDLCKQADEDEAVINEIEAGLYATVGTEYDGGCNVYGEGTVQELENVPVFGWQVVTACVETGNPLMDPVMENAGYRDYTVFYEYNFGLAEPYYSGLNTPVRAGLSIGDAYYEYVFREGRLLLRKAPEGTSYNPKVNDFINSIYKIGWYYGECLNGIPDLDRTRITVYSPAGQIRDDGNAILFSNETELADSSEVYVLDADTIFDEGAVTDFFEGYQPGDTPMAWVRRMLEQQDEHPMALAGVFEVSVTDGHIDSLNGIYWWD